MVRTPYRLPNGHEARTADEVLAVMGPPTESRVFGRRRQMEWRYTNTTVAMNFDESGRVTSAAQRLVERPASAHNEWMRVFAVSVALLGLLVAITMDL